jgi:hypothetical protein
VIQFTDYVHAIHDDRRRSFEAAAGRAAVKASRQSNPRQGRSFKSRRVRAGRRHSVRGAPTG